MEKSVHGKARRDSWKMKKSKGNSAIPNMTLTPDTMEANKRFMVDGIVRTRPTTPNVIMALLKTPNMIDPHPALCSVGYHLKSDISMISYHCAQCDIGFIFSHCMKKHMKLHPVENSYQCALCGK